MESVKSNPSSGDLDSFIQFLYEGLEGYVYIAARDKTKDPEVKNSGYWQQKYFKYPEKEASIKHLIRTASESYGLDVFIAPALFSKEEAIRENFKCSNVVWTEFDGNAPVDWTDTHGEPSITIQSSGSGNTHTYWKLSQPITSANEIEDINRRITYNMGADFSAWDAIQVLRPPETHNYKREVPESVFIRNDSSRVYDIDIFSGLGPAPEGITVDWELTTLPDINDVILGYSFTPDLIKLIKADKHEVKDRSTSLMNLAYGAAQMGLHNNEIMVLLLNADDRWEKFKGRRDRLKRLSHIITLAKNKHPGEDEDEDEDFFTLAYGFDSFLNADIDINWVIEPMLMENGNMLLVGPSGIGKTQIMLQFAIHLALGRDFLHYKIAKPNKIILLSLEMGPGELKTFVKTMNEALDDADRVILEANLLLVPHGEPWFLNTPEGQSELIKLIEVFQPDGVMVDSIGSAVVGNISSDESIQPLTKFNDKIRKKYNLWTWYIHHMRKAKDGGISQDDVYGNQYILNRSTSTYAAVKSKDGLIKIRNFKNRLAANEKDYHLQRTETLGFELTTNGVTSLIKHMTEHETPSVSSVPSTSTGNIEL